MKFGVVLPNYGADASRLAMVDTTLLAEDLGFDSVWLTDHVALPKTDAARFGRIFEAVTTAAYLAASTGRIRLGISALVLPQRNPVVIAKQIATLDVLSGGRVLLAAGVGWSAGEYANLGADFHDRGRRMDEALQVLRTLWRGGEVISYHGRYYQLEQAVFLPGPLQPGGPPLWVAGNSEAARRRAALYADGWHPNAPADPETLAAQVQALRPLLGGRPFTVSLRIRLSFTAQSPQEAQLYGPPAQIAARLRAYADAGADYFAITFLADSQPRRERMLRRFVEEVWPCL